MLKKLGIALVAMLASFSVVLAGCSSHEKKPANVFTWTFDYDKDGFAENKTYCAYVDAGKIGADYWCKDVDAERIPVSHHVKFDDSNGMSAGEYASAYFLAEYQGGRINPPGDAEDVRAFNHAMSDLAWENGPDFGDRWSAYLRKEAGLTSPSPTTSS